LRKYNERRIEMSSINRISKRLTILFALSVILLFASTGYAQMGGGHMGGGNGQGTGIGNMASGLGGMMLISGGTPYRQDGRMVQMQDATAIAAQYLSFLGNAALALDRVEEWEFNYLVIIKEVASQYKAFELLIDKWTGNVSPGMGPDMAWNQKYAGMMNSIMENGTGHMSRRERRMTQPSITVDAGAAAEAARQFLAQRLKSGLVLSGQAETFYGYYCFDVNDEKGVKYGRLSVNGISGQVWYHTWHGNFVR
jgi:hypothetical protein